MTYPIRTFLLIICCLALLAAATPQSVTIAAPPNGFSDELVTELGGPTALAFTPAGQWLITTRSGKLYVYQQNTLQQPPAIDFNPAGKTPLICTNGERGLLGVTVDPEFATTRHIYLYYTYNKHQSPTPVCSKNTPDTDPVNRVSRFTLSLSNTVALTSELVLVDNIPSPNSNHNAGDLQFGKDGHLYISVGDGGCDYDDPTKCAGENPAARDKHMLLGKILRITRNGGVPSDNPFATTGNRCYEKGGNESGRTTPGSHCQETFAWGLRNPFRMAFDPNATSTRFFINDVGQNKWDEIDEGLSGADYGWNKREGFCANGSTLNCRPTPTPGYTDPATGYTDPIFHYGHGDGCSSITGGAFVPQGAWPAEFDGTYLYSDYVCGKIFKLTRSGNSYQSEPFVTGLGTNSAVHMTFGPHAGGQALYYTTFSGGGSVRRIVFSGSANRSPLAVASATPRFGPAPLLVNFSAAGSSDPDNDTLSYSWNFGDGASGAGVSVSHTYATSGTYTATLTVRDSRDAVSTPVQLRIDVGNNAPVPTILAPAPDLRFSVGQTVTLSGAASDDSGIAPVLSWEVRQHHVYNSGENSHFHPFLTTTGPTVTLQLPGPEDLESTRFSYLEIRLTATDNQGLSTLITQTLRPKIVAVGFDSQPQGRRLVLNETTVLTTPQTLDSWQNYAIEVTVPPQFDAQGRPLVLERWLDAGREPTRTIMTGATPITYTARFTSSFELSDTFRIILTPLLN